MCVARLIETLCKGAGFKFGTTITNIRSAVKRGTSFLYKIRAVFIAKLAAPTVDTAAGPDTYLT